MTRLRHLPALPALLAFEAAAAHENFSAAGRHIGMSQSAVSQHVQQIEQEIGQKLFRRLHRGVALTEAGRTLATALTMGLDRIEEALATLRQEAEAPSLSIATDFGFASFWLMPHLSDLAGALPGVEVRIVTSQHRRISPAPDADVTIAFGPAEPGAQLLFAERVMPVCSPAFRERCRLQDGAFDWARLPLLDLDAAEPGRWLDWRDWFTQAGLPKRRGQAPMLHFNTYPLVVEAAMQGQGAALGWRPLVDRQLAAGLLVPMAAEVATTTRGYALAIPERAAARPAVEAFRRWLLAECGVS
ncbi:MAG TPA: LysR substrate-binding domain-containing protein [Acidisoma sp.]|uniref:LysR substrate-binding domain-containing protein n=1 Tax=Acidisoma sp. TaxID=1872115 RepID=UPI002B9EFB99|nr:LysR substrate-binding domain-containing protein [Acidisoma sp.]HTI02751.1 LysR substrate-binding domain-containing protein [Acidisoma sp.]